MDTLFKIRQPHYVANFNCISSQCEDTCCANWEQINIDKSTYEKYMNCFDPDIAPLITKYVTTVSEDQLNHQESPYAVIHLNEVKTCPFLNEDSLCRIQKKWGPHYLSSTCANYPRHVNVVNGVIERSLRLSCPEAVRLALTEPDAIRFQEIQIPNTDFSGTFKVLDTIPTESHGELYPYLLPLRSFIIELLQNRSYGMEFRLIALGCFCQEISQQRTPHQMSRIPELIAGFSKSLPANIDKAKGLPNAPSFQVQLLIPILNEVTQNIFHTHPFLQHYHDFLHGLQIGNSDLALTVNTYNHAFKKWYQPFISSYPHIIENYLTHYVFERLFPLDFANVYDSYTVLILNYAFIKTLLIGLAGNYKEAFSTEQVFALIQSYTKTFSHDSFLENTLILLKHNGLMSLSSLAMLIKNESACEALG